MASTEAPVGPGAGPRRRRLAGLLAGCLVAALGAGGWLWYRGSQLQPPPAPLAASGTLEADETLIAPQVTGLITTLPVAEGDRVTAGEVVARLDDRTIQLQLRQAGGATLPNLQLQSEYYVLHAPVSGVVTRLPVHVGETAMPGEVLLGIADLDQLKLTLYVREADLSRVRVGQWLEVTADPFPGRTFNGRVTSVNQQAEFTPRNVQTQTDRLNLVFGVQATVANPDGALKPGMPVDARFVAGGGP